MKGRKYDELNYDKIHIYIQLPISQALYDLKSTSLLREMTSASASHTIIIEIIIIKIPSRCMTVYLTRGFFYQHGQS